jgi:di/tricarboxylate transporter
MTTAALLSIVALALVVLVSCINEEIHPGILSIGFAILVGGVCAGLKGTDVLKFFPIDLFMILVGVTFLFAMAQVNGTMSKVTAHAVRLCGGNVMLVPVTVFILTTIFTTIGPGNIAATALMAPLAMAIASRINMSAFLMTLLVVGAADGAAFSPFAPTGIISNGLIASKIAPVMEAMKDVNLQSLAWKIHWNSEIAQGVVNIGGFLILGGLAWFKKQKGGSLNIDEIAPKPEPFTAKQIYTIAAIVALLLLIICPGLSFVKPYIPLWLKNITANVGTIGFILSAVLLLLNVSDSKEAMKTVPWGVILMVCGVTVLIGVMDEAGGLAAMVSIISRVSDPVTVNGWLGLVTGILSAYSSSSGVVMPMFLPMVPGLIQELGGGDPVSLISSINIGAHLVDTSPLSTLGALCIACAGAHENKARLFRNLLIWGLSMSLVGAVSCLIFFGVLGL